MLTLFIILLFQKFVQENKMKNVVNEIVTNVVLHMTSNYAKTIFFLNVSTS